MWYSTAAPEKVRVTVEVDHANGDKTILRTVDLDARHIRPSNSEEDPSHLTVGMVDPYRSLHEELSGYRGYYSSFPDHLFPHHDTFFDLNIQLEKHPDAPEDHVYTMQYIEKPSNVMVLSYMPHAHVVHTTTMTVDEAAEHIDSHSTQRIYFVVEIP
jgi:hypothetical protein